MQHRIPTDRLGPRGEAMADAVGACVHCGFCLPTCPTYVTLGEEMDSPRGRILLMKGMLEGEIETEEGMPFVDRCLGCLACVTSCPSGVEYGELVTSFRAHSRPNRSPRPLQAVLLETLARPRLLRASARLAGLGRALAPALPRALRSALDLLPRRLPDAPPLPHLVPVEGARRARVALLTGCAQEALAPSITRAAVRVLTRRGVEVVIPPRQGCCGALAWHAGDEERAKSWARRLLEAFPADVDAVVSTAAGCGSGLQDYGLIFRGDPEQQAAEELSARAVDVSAFLLSLDPPPPPALTDPLTAVYQDACHLAHAQGLTEPPRQLLRAIEGLEISEPQDAQLCCGSAGLYNLEHPEIADDLGDRKARALLEAGGDLVISGNIGCRMQIEKHLDRLGQPRPVRHTVEVLDLADRRALGPGG